MIFPKKQAHRLIPEYLLDYTTKLNESHPDPTESWGGSGGSNYTAGDGIDISTGNVISVDNTIAKKSEIPTNYVTLDTEQTITSPKTINSQLNFGDGIHNSILINADYANNPIISMLKDTTGGEFSIGVDDGAYFTYEDNNGLKTYKLPYQDATGINTYTFATTSDIPSLDGYATQTWVQNQGYATSSSLATVATSGSYNDLLDKPTLATVATSGSYNDLSDKPTIPDTSNLVTLDTEQIITGPKWFNDGKLAVFKNSGDFADRLIFYQTLFKYISATGAVEFALPISKQSDNFLEPTKYTLATTSDIPDTTKFVTTDTVQTITGDKTFKGALKVENYLNGRTMTYDGFGSFDLEVKNQGTIERMIFELPTYKPKGTEGSYTQYTLATEDDIHNPTITFTQGGTTKGTITLNQDTDATIALDAGGGGSSAPFEISNMQVDSSNQTITLTIVANS